MKYKTLLALAMVLPGSAVACTPSETKPGGDKDTQRVAELPGGEGGVRGARADWSGESQHSEPPFLDVAFLPDGKQLLSASHLGVILWDLQNGKIIRIMEKSRPSGKLALSADGKYVLAAAGGAVCLWEVGTGKRVSVLKNEQNVVHALALANDKTLALVGGNGPLTGAPPHPKFPDNLQIWDIPKREVKYRLLGYNTAVVSVAISSDSNLGLSGGCEIEDFRTGAGKYTIKLWDLRSGEMLRRYELPLLDWGKVYFSPDDKRMYCIGKRLRAWDVDTGILVHSFEDLGKKRGPLAFSQDKRYYITQEGLEDSPPDTTLTLWDLHTGKAVKVLEKGKPKRIIGETRFSPNGRLIALAGDAQLLQIWNLETGKMALDLKVPTEIRDPARTLKNKDSK